MIDLALALSDAGLQKQPLPRPLTRCSDGSHGHPLTWRLHEDTRSEDLKVTRMIRVLIVAGIRLYREGLELMLSNRKAFEVVGAIPDRDRTIRGAADLRPDVVLLDLATTDSRDILRDLTQLRPDLPIVGLAVPDHDRDVVGCMEAGLAGFVSREGSIDDLVGVVEDAARGELNCPPKIAGLLQRRLAELSAARVAPVAAPRLTRREGEIFELLKQNLSNKEIAVRLGIEVTTAKNHVHNLLEKLNIHRRYDVATSHRRAASLRDGR